MQLPEYESKDAVGLAEWIRRGDVSAAEVLEAAIERLEARDPQLGAVPIRTLDDARARVARGAPQGPFGGVPFLVKDLHLQVEGVRTTNGCSLFADAVADHDSELVTRYRAAGLAFLGRSASPEFGLTTTTESRLFGQTRNPWSLEHSSGGSSGGASAAVAAGIVPMANASDGGGSIRIPASCCGLVGLKPTRGRTPLGPDAGEGWAGMSTVHCVSRSVRDTAVLLDVSHGADLGAPYWPPAVTRPYAQEIEKEPGRLRVALATRSFSGVDTDPECREAAQRAATLCESLGHHVEEADPAMDTGAIAQASPAIIGGNVLATCEARAETLGRELTEADVEPATWRMIQAARQRSAADYANGVKAVHAAGRAFAHFLQDYDVLVTPTLACLPPRLGEAALSNPDPAAQLLALLRSTGYTQALNATGTPAISLPLHWSGSGLPVGVQFAGRFGDEATLLRLAAQIERAAPWFDRRPEGY